MSDKTWIGVDFDGTLAHYDEWRGPLHFGEPILPMLDRVKSWIADGKTVKIITARVGYSSIMDDPDVQAGHNNHQDLRREITIGLQDWCEKYGVPRLAVTAEKDYLMTEFWDDRCVQVIPNMGIALKDALDALP